MLKKIFLKTLLLIAFLLANNFAKAQIFTPVKWAFSSKKISDTEAELVIKATIDKGWHVYSQFIANDGPVPTSFSFEKNKSFELIGKVSESKPIEEHDVNFDMLLKYFEGTATFKQKIKLLGNKEFTIKGSLEFMSCDNSKCLPPETVEFEIKSEGATTSVKGSSESDVVTTPAEQVTPIIDTSKNTENIVPVEKKKI